VGLVWVGAVRLAEPVVLHFGAILVIGAVIAIDAATVA
jgi:hypothetical protein